MNNWTINVRIEKNHLVTDLNGHLMLIDTGSPTSFGEASITWDGEEKDLRDSPLGFSCETLRKHVGLGLKGLIGCDLLFKRGLLIDIPNGKLTLQDETARNDESIPLESIMGVPMVTTDIAGEATKVAIDTGAMQSFVRDHSAEGLSRVGTVDDFLPTGGEFTAELVEMQAVIGATHHAIKPAVMPSVLETLLSLMSINGIIGLDVLQHSEFEFSVEAGYMTPQMKIQWAPNPLS